ncbi:MAG TPA: calcium-binding protein [Conexibacter sp.]|nr:calcium-binding protein [Conexibacter sp.]
MTVTNTPYSPQEVTIAGGAGADHLETYQTRAALDGGDGDDLLRPDDRPSALSLPPVPTPGGTVAGGRGVDTVSYDNALDPIDVSLDGRPNDGRAGERDDVRPDVENVIGSPFAGTLIGSAAGNALRGGNGDDTIVGHAGRDDLAGAAGADTIDALDGAGGDRVDCDNGTTATDVAYADAGDAIAAGTCERVVWAPAIGSTTLRLHDGRVALALSCPRGGSACRGDVRLRSAAGRPFALAGGRYTIRSGGRASLPLTASRALRAALRGSRRVRATAIVSPRGRVASSGRAVIVRR